MALERLVSEIATTINRQDGEGLNRILQPQNVKRLIARVDKSMLDLACSYLPDPNNETFSNYLAYAATVDSGNAVDAFEFLNNSVSAFSRAFASHESNWAIPVAHSLSYRLRLIAERADAQLKQQGMEPQKLAEAERTIKRVFTPCTVDRNPLEISKKWGSLYLIVNLFKIYFKLGNIRLCRNLIRWVEGPAFPDFNQFPLSETVTYNFYCGRLSMYEDNFAKAETELWYALQHCHRRAVNNKRSILQYLIPVKLYMGKMPTKRLLDKYRLNEFVGITEAVRTGNLRLFNDSLEQYQEIFIRKGTFLILEKLKMLVYRNLFKKIHRIINSPKIKLSSFEVALNMLGAEIDLDEVECIVANLVYQGWIKGYVSHVHRILVVSKENAFPNPNTILPSR